MFIDSTGPMFFDRLDLVLAYGRFQDFRESVCRDLGIEAVAAHEDCLTACWLIEAARDEIRSTPRVRP